MVITVERIRELIEYTHRKGALAMSFLNSNVEAADRDTIREITLLMKQTGCDVHAIGDGGFGGGTWPENLYQMSITLKRKSIYLGTNGNTSKMMKFNFIYERNLVKTDFFFCY